MPSHTTFSKCTSKGGGPNLITRTTILTGSCSYIYMDTHWIDGMELRPCSHESKLATSHLDVLGRPETSTATSHRTPHTITHFQPPTVGSSQDTSLDQSDSSLLANLGYGSILPQGSLDLIVELAREVIIRKLTRYTQHNQP